MAVLLPFAVLCLCVVAVPEEAGLKGCAKGC